MKKKYSIKKINKRLDYLENEIESLNNIVKNHDEKNKCKKEKDNSKKWFLKLTDSVKTYKPILFLIIYPMITALMLLFLGYLAVNSSSTFLVIVFSIFKYTFAIMLPIIAIFKSYNYNKHFIATIIISIILFILVTFIQTKYAKTDIFILVIISIVSSLVITIILIKYIYKLYDWIYCSYKESLKTTDDAFDVKAKLVTIVTTICISSIGTILTAILSIGKIIKFLSKV